MRKSAVRFVIPGDTPCKDVEERCQLLLLRLRLCDIVGVIIVCGVLKLKEHALTLTVRSHGETGIMKKQ